MLHFSRRGSLLGLIIFGCVLLTTLGGYYLIQPAIYRHVTSPDGTWSVTVLRRRIWPYFEGVEVMLRIKRSDGSLLFEAPVDRRDLWSDVDARYPEVQIDNQSLLLGPDYWGQNQFLTIRKADLEQDIPVLTRLHSHAPAE